MTMYHVMNRMSPWLAKDCTKNQLMAYITHLVQYPILLKNFACNWSYFNTYCVYNTYVLLSFLVILLNCVE